MKFNVTTRVDGMQAVRHRFNQIEKAPDAVIKKVAVEEVAATQERIRNSKTDPEGRPWTPWSMATMRQRQKEGNAGQGLLYRTGSLLNSIQYRISNKTLTIFSNVGHGKFHQFGTSKMDARPFLGWSRTSINRIRDLFKENVEK